MGEKNRKKSAVPGDFHVAVLMACKRFQRCLTNYIG